MGYVLAFTAGAALGVVIMCCLQIKKIGGKRMEIRARPK